MKLQETKFRAGLLQLLEYHTGIVILTTNRISDFDVAFHSRIHVSMEYTALSPREKRAIWHKELSERLSDNRHAITQADLEALAQLDLDGRTICNTVHVLKLFMEQEKKEIVSIRQVKRILGIATGKLQVEARKQIQEFCRT